MKTSLMFSALAFLLSTSACDADDEQNPPSSADTDATPSGESGAAPPTDASISDCRDACGELQTFDCIDGNTHEACWNVYQERSEGDLELFASCVSNSLPSCDPDCLDGLLDAAEPSSTGGDLGPCESACGAYADAGCDVSELSGVEECALLCGALSSDFADYVATCFDSPETCEINPRCLDDEEGGGPADETGGE